jgi:hypothetical protein
MELRAFKQAFGRPLAEAGFSHKGQTWFADRAEVVGVVNLQKSQYSSECFMNLGFWLKQMGRPPTMPPSEHLCHARVRAESLFPALGLEMSKLLNRESAIPDEERSTRLSVLLKDVVVPFVNYGTTAAGLREHIAEGRFEAGLVHVDLMRALGL